MKFPATAACLSFLLSSTGAMAQCEVFPNPLRSAATEMETGVLPIFQLLPAPSRDAVGGKNPAWGFASVPDEEFLIVPGKRAGAVDIGSTLDRMRSTLKLSALRKKTEERYAEVLPLGYVPERLFASSEKPKMKFAFSTVSRTLWEIFVLDERYSTAEGIRVGSPRSALDRVLGLTEKTVGKSAACFQGDGITFVVDRGAVTEIVVVRRIKGPT